MTMKKYFLKGVDEPLDFGDTLEFDLIKEGEKNKKITKHVTCTFIPEVVSLLLEEEVIEEKEVEDDIPIEDGPSEEEETEYENLVDAFTEFETLTTDILKSLTERIENLEKKVCPKGKVVDVFGFAFQ